MWAWKLAMIFVSFSSLSSSSIPSTPALKKTFVVPSLYSAGSSWRASKTFSATSLPSAKPCGIALGAKMEYLSTWKVMTIGLLYKVENAYHEYMNMLTWRKNTDVIKIGIKAWWQFKGFLSYNWKLINDPCQVFRWPYVNGTIKNFSYQSSDQET